MKAYTQAGVDVDLGNQLKSGIAARVKSTRRPEVLGSLGGFGGLFAAAFPKLKHPVLVASIDGVGTKVKVASQMGCYNTIGEDLVNHCVNDIAVLGAEPLFFLDYFGTSQLDPQVFSEILEGLSRACRQSRCALLGGETAQMPGIYQKKDFDLVGAIVGIVDRKKIIDGQKIKPGDVVLGVPSSGLHTNGYSLARRVLIDSKKFQLNRPAPGLTRSLGAALLEPHRSYLPLIRKLSAKVKIRGMAHITGGGLIDNIPRVLPEGVQATLDLGSWPISPLFRLLAEQTQLPNDELYQVFNMGIGMVFIIREKEAERAQKILQGYRIGRIEAGERRVIFHEKASILPKKKATSKRVKK